MNTEQLDQQSSRLAPFFRSYFLPENPVTFQFNFDDADPFHLTVDHAEFVFKPGYAQTSTLSLWLDQPTTLWRLLEGRLDGMDAFLTGQYRADGNIVLSQLLLYLFQSPEPVLAHDISD